MATSEIEDLQLEVIQALCKLTKENLIDFCGLLGITAREPELILNKPRTVLITMISSHLQRDELGELEDQGLAELLYLKDKIQEYQDTGELTVRDSLPQLEVLQVQTPQSELKDTVNQSNDQVIQQKKADNETDEQIKLAKEIETLQLKLMLMQKQNENKVHSGTPQVACTAHPQATNPWNKDFKISGQIGEPGQKDRLTFSSLARQIEHGLVKGFPEPEIVDAVIRAITPGMQLRSYLEGKANLSLPALRRILRCHYQEKSATDLYKQLSSEAQNNKETPQSFVIRALDLRQKILFASQESESGLKYDPVLVQSMFLHTVLTGLQNDNIKRDLQPYLELATVSDELLLEKLNIACACESERQDKRKALTPHRIAVHSADTNESRTDKREKAPTSQSNSKVQPDLLAELKEMRSNMTILNDLKAEVSQIKDYMQKPQPQVQVDPSPGTVAQPMTVPFSMPPQMQWPGPVYMYQNPKYSHVPPQRFSAPGSRRKRRCFACQENKIDDCKHCYACGSDDHFLAGCRMRGARQSRPLNERGLLQRDQQ